MNTKHIFFMPDGNRRYATKKGIFFKQAYEQGFKSLKLFSDFFLLKHNWDELTFHVMTKYTHDRTDGSLVPIYEALFNGFSDLQKNQYFQKNDLKLIVINHSDKLPKNILEITGKISEQTKKNKKIIRVLLGYDLEVDEKNAFDEAKSYNEFKKLRLIPQVNLALRTTEMRFSKGPVYAMEQAQMILLNKLNPELTEKDLENALKEYNSLLDYRRITNPVHKI